MSEERRDYVDETEEVENTVKLKDGLILKELVKDLSTEFSLDASKGECPEPEYEKRVDTCYDFKDFEPYINLDCIQVDSTETDPKSPFDRYREKMFDVTNGGEVKKMVKRAGNGEVVPQRSVIYIHYNSYLEMEEVPFDTSYLRTQKPLRFQLGTGTMYPGFEIAVSTMKVGELSQYLVQPDYAFGKMGVPPRIPPNATILLEIEMLNFVDCGGAVTPITEDKTKFPNAYNAAKSFQALANDYFANKNIPAAAENYRKAERLLIGCYMMSDKEEKEQKKLLLKIYVNLSICYNDPKMRMPQKVCMCARDAMYCMPKEARTNAKLQYNWGKALMVLNDFEGANKHLKLALAIQPNNSDICQQLKVLESKKKQYYEQEKICYKKALKLNKIESEERKPEEDKVSREFIALVVEQLKEFKEGLPSRIQLPPGLTGEERSKTRELAEQLGLSYQEQVVGTSVTITIHKHHSFSP